MQLEQKSTNLPSFSPEPKPENAFSEAFLAWAREQEGLRALAADLPSLALVLRSLGPQALALLGQKLVCRLKA